MIFNTIPFFFFLLVVLGIYWSLPSDRWRHPFLLTANFFFYGWWNWKFTALLFAVILISYVAGLLIQQAESGSQRKKQFMMGSCTLLLGVLGYFKYTNFFLASLHGAIENLGGHLAQIFHTHLLWKSGSPMNAVLDSNFDLSSMYSYSPASKFASVLPHQTSQLPRHDVYEISGPGWTTLNIILPAGISFYIFQAISYVVTIYREKLSAEKSFIKLGVYLSFFPHLVAGPIIHAPTFLPQLAGKRLFDAASFVEGARKFALGFLYKAVFADNIAAAVNPIFSSIPNQEPLTLLGGCLGFYGQIYFDFAGYSLMAIGVANLLGYTLPDNFNFPYRATSLIDFWRRWHISLSTWLRDYVYIPLGGNRCPQPRHYFNIIATMFLGGLWHGASWNFLLWGGVHGLALCLNHAWRSMRKKECSSVTLSWILTQGIVFCCWIPFRAATLSETMLIFHKLGSVLTKPLILSASVISFPWALVLLPLFFDMALNGSEHLRACWSLRSTTALYAAIAGALLMGLLFMHSGTVNFIYFQF